MDDSLRFFLLISLAFQFTAFTLAWLAARHWQFFSLVDVVWTFALGIELAFVAPALSPVPETEPALLFRWMLGLWSLRLGFYLVRRLAKQFPAEDKRYLALRRQYGHQVNFRFWTFFLAQAFSTVLLSSLFWPIFTDLTAEVSALRCLALALWTVGFAGEAMADRQLATFKKSPLQPGKSSVCQEGLWKYSQHPNYFFELLQWWSWALFVWPSPTGWTGALAAAVMSYLIVKVTGIAFSDKMVAGNPAYAQYQKTTSSLIPWWPRKF